MNASFLGAEDRDHVSVSSAVVSFRTLAVSAFRKRHSAIRLCWVDLLGDYLANGPMRMHENAFLPVTEHSFLGFLKSALNPQWFVSRSVLVYECYETWSTSTNVWRDIAVC